MTLFATWGAEPLPATPAAVEGAERLALSVTLAALGAARTFASVPAAVVVAPAAMQGSRELAKLLELHRERLRAPVAFWVRALREAPQRRRVYLGARGRVVLGVWGEVADASRIQDELVGRLREEAYGPRPLDFELLRKLGQDPSALFEPKGQVVAPSALHEDRPRAWIILETTESMEPADLYRRARELAGAGARIEMTEGFLWDRLNIHHPAIQAEISLSKVVSAGPDIWPMAPWSTPSGLFTRAIGTPLAEWGIPLPPSTAARSPNPEAFERMVREAAALLLRGAGVAPLPDVPRAE